MPLTQQMKVGVTKPNFFCKILTALANNLVKLIDRPWIANINRIVLLITALLEKLLECWDVIRQLVFFEITDLSTSQSNFNHTIMI